MKTALFVLAAMLSAAPALAQDGLPEGMVKMDANKDGKVSAAEWATNSAATFTKLDANGNGSFDHAEIAARYPKETGDVLEARATKMLKADTNADGKVSSDEAKAAAQTDFQRRDKNSDGFITADETKK